MKVNETMLNSFLEFLYSKKIIGILENETYESLIDQFKVTLFDGVIMPALDHNTNATLNLFYETKYRHPRYYLIITPIGQNQESFSIRIEHYEYTWLKIHGIKETDADLGTMQKY